MRDAENRLLTSARSEALLSGSTTISVPMIGRFEIDVIGDPGQDAITIGQLAMDEIGMKDLESHNSQSRYADFCN